MSALFNHYRPMQQERNLLVPAFALGKCDEQGSWNGSSINDPSGCRSSVGDAKA
jgi:hypothetical protein